MSELKPIVGPGLLTAIGEYLLSPEISTRVDRGEIAESELPLTADCVFISWELGTTAPFNSIPEILINTEEVKRAVEHFNVKETEKGHVYITKITSDYKERPYILLSGAGPDGWFVSYSEDIDYDFLNAIIKGPPVKKAGRRKLPALMSQAEYGIVPRQVWTALKLRRTSALAELGVETKIYTEGGKPAELTGNAYFTFLVLLKYLYGCPEPFIRALFNDRGKIWLPKITTLFDYCYSRREFNGDLDGKKIRRGFDDLQKKQLIARELGGNLYVETAPWIEVERTPKITPEIRKLVDPKMEKHIKRGMFIMPNAILDLYLNSGFIVIYPDFTDRLADARDTTGLNITDGRIDLAIRIAEDIALYRSGRRHNAIKDAGNYIELNHVRGWYVDALGLGALVKRRKPSLVTEAITDGLRFVKAGGFISTYEKTAGGYRMFIEKGKTDYMDALYPHSDPVNDLLDSVTDAKHGQKSAETDKRAQ